ncbi:MAG TPA: patatin-like phospholipase family protein [Thermoanaerobaculia bacterium]|nr:patatin-like phospholipase family protein [Thermoanaerobaculia bacterium]
MTSPWATVPPRADPVREPRHAVILSGGGATGAYEVGVLKALLNGASPATGHAPILPVSCAGTSVGSFNAAFLVSWLDRFGPAVADQLQSVWLGRLCETGWSGGVNGVYRFRFNPLAFADPSYYAPNPLRPILDALRDGAFLFRDGLIRLASLADLNDDLRQRLANLVDFAAFVTTEPFRDTIRDTVDFARIRLAATKLRIPATNWNTGRLTVFTNGEMTDDVGPLAVLASSAMPGIFPPVYIGAEPHLDGGVLMNTPLRLVTRHAEVLHVVYLDPDVSRIPNRALQSTLSTAYRQQVIAWAKAMNDDLEDAAAINRVIALKQRLERGEDPGPPDPDLEARGIGSLLERLERREPPYRKLTIHRYHPRDDLTGGPLGLLRLEAAFLRRLIDRGYSDTVEHDCAVSGCIGVGDGPSREERADAARPLL